MFQNSSRKEQILSKVDHSYELMLLRAVGLAYENPTPLQEVVSAGYSLLTALREFSEENTSLGQGVAERNNSRLATMRELIEKPPHLAQARRLASDLQTAVSLAFLAFFVFSSWRGNSAMDSSPNIPVSVAVYREVTTPVVYADTIYHSVWKPIETLNRVGKNIAYSMGGVLIPNAANWLEDQEGGINFFRGPCLQDKQADEIAAEINSAHQNLAAMLQSELYESKTEIPNDGRPALLFSNSDVVYPMGVPKPTKMVCYRARGRRLEADWATGKLPRLNGQPPAILEDPPYCMADLFTDSHPEHLNEVKDVPLVLPRYVTDPDVNVAETELLYPHGRALRHSPQRHVQTMERGYNLYLEGLQDDMCVSANQCRSWMKGLAFRVITHGAFVMTLGEAEEFHHLSLTYGLKARIYRESVKRLPAFRHYEETGGFYTQPPGDVMLYREAAILSWGADLLQRKTMPQYLGLGTSNWIEINTPIPVLWTDDEIRC